MNIEQAINNESNFQTFKVTVLFEDMTEKEVTVRAAALTSEVLYKIETMHPGCAGLIF